MHWLSKTRGFWNQCDEKSRGTSGKNRIRPEKFLQITIPLPPLEEQRRIVGRIEALAARIAEAQRLRRAAMAEAEGLMSQSRARLIGNQPTSDWISLRSYVAQIENGWSPACESRQVEGDEWGVLKVGAVSFGVFDPTENKALPPSLLPQPQYEVMPGDFLMSRANTYDLVGACAIVEETPHHLMLSDKLFRFVFREPDALNLSYLNHVLKSPALREQIVRKASGILSPVSSVN